MLSFNAWLLNWLSFINCFDLWGLRLKNPFKAHRVVLLPRTINGTDSSQGTEPSKEHRREKVGWRG